MKTKDIRKIALFEREGVAQWILFVLFASLLFIKIVMFQVEAFHSLMISSVIHKQLSFWSFWLPKVGVSVLLASLLFFFKRNYWSIVISLFTDVWMLANLVYTRSRPGLLFDGYTFMMTDNMDGFWGSILPLLRAIDIVPFVLTIVWAFVLWYMNHYVSQRMWKIGVVALLISLLFNWYSLALVNKFYTNYAYEMGGLEPPKRSSFYYMKNNHFSYKYRLQLMPLNSLSYGFYHFSVLHGFVYVMLDYIHNLNAIVHPRELTEIEQMRINKSVVSDNRVIKHESPLIIIIVESFENWAINEYVTPNICKAMEAHPHLWARVGSQVRVGTSADGQMIINTGLLPVKQGATCFRFPYIVYPSLVDKQDSSVCVLTHGINVWNQAEMSKAYGYMTTVESDNPSDSLLAIRMLDYVKRDYKTVMGITIRSHTPFGSGKCSKLVLPEKMPTRMSNYLKCINLADEGLGLLLNQMDSVPQLQNATIVLTGDHNIFWEDNRRKFADYCQKSGDSYSVWQEECPLIVFSPRITENIVIEEPCWQMDIFPTLLSATGNEDYFWHGFGVDLLDFAARHEAIINRNISSQAAYEMSEMIFESNYFGR